MDVAQAKAFVAVAEELHFGRAAERLRIAQPPLSRMIKQLESSLGAELFLRSTRHVELTPAGASLVEPAKALIDASEAARRTVQETISGNIGAVKIGFAGASTHKSVVEIARRVKRQNPRIKLELHSSQFSHVGLQKVLDGSLDTVIGRWAYLPAEVDGITVGVERIIVAVPATHPLASKSVISIKDLADDPWVVLPSGFAAALQNRLSSMAMAAGFVPRIANVAPDSWTLTVLVGAEMGVAITLDSVRNNVSDDNVVFRSLAEKDDQLEVQMIWKRDNRNPALRSVIDIAERVFNKTSKNDADRQENPAI